MSITNITTTSGDATVYGGDFGGRAQGNWDGKAYGFNTATGVPMNVVTNSVAMHDTSLKYHIVRVTNHDTGITKYALVTNVMGNPKSAGDLTPELAESLGVKLNEEPFHDSSLNQTFRLVKGDDARNLTFEVVGELKNKKYGDVETAERVGSRLSAINTPEDIQNFDNEDAEFYPEFKQAISEKGIAYMPESTANLGQVARLAPPKDTKPSQQEAVTRLTSGFEHNPNESDEDHKRRLNKQMVDNLALMPEEDQALFMGIMALILFAMGEHEQAAAMLEGLSPSAIGGNYDQYEPALSSTGTGGRRYNPTSQEYDGQNVGASPEVLGNYSKMVDPSQLPSSESTLKSGSIGSLRDAIKVEYTSRLAPYLYTGDIKDIPADAPVVVLDLGHLGKGSDLGAGRMTPGGYLCEAGACMESNIAMAQKLSEQGVIVLSTTQSPRFENNTLSPSARQQFTQAVVNRFANDIAKNSGRDEATEVDFKQARERVFFVSTHFNDAGSATVSGASMYLDKDNPASVAYATEMQGALENSGAFKRFGQGVIDESSTQHGGLSVTTKTFPSVLAELGFCKGDGEKLSNKAYMQKVGETMADAVINVGAQRYAWRVQEKETEMAAETPANSTEVSKNETMRNGDGSLLKPVSSEAPNFAELTKGVKVPDGVSVQSPQEPTKETASIEGAKKLTAGIELKDLKVEGWPPGVDSSVLDAAKAAESQRLS